MNHLITALFFSICIAITTSLTAQCVPFTCADISLTGGTPTTPSATSICGLFGDGCGGIITCSSCPDGQTCGGGGIPFMCGFGACTPLPCGSLAGIECGGGNGCGGLMSCGCASPETCGGSGTAYACGCTPLTCQTAGVGCGIISDNCGGILFCNDCDLGDPSLTCLINQLSNITAPTPLESAVLTAIANAPDNTSVLYQLMGLQYIDSMLMTELANERFINTLFVPVRAIITNDPSCTFQNDSCSTPVTIWEEASYNNVQSRHTHPHHRYNSNGYELSIGAQTTVASFWTIGTAFSFAYDSIHYTHSSHGNSCDYFGGLYGVYRPCGFYCLSDLVVGYRDEHVSRHINLRPNFTEEFVAHGKPKTFQSALYFESGVDFNYCNILFQPFIGLEAGYYSRQKFHENGATPLNLHIGSKEQADAYTSLGVHMSTLSLCNIELGFDIAWQYRCSRLHNNLTQNFVAFGNACEISGGYINRNSLDGAVYFNTCLCNGLELFGNASTQLRQNAYSYSLLLGIQSTF